MVPRKVVTRPAMTRPVALRRSSSVTGEIRVCQELIRLAAERTRAVQEQRIWLEKLQGFKGRLQSIDRYREDLLKRLGVPNPQDSPKRVQSSEGEEQDSGNRVMKLRF